MLSVFTTFLMLERSNLDVVYQYILAAAALSDDFQQRRLGPIHFLKYAYLADLAYARRNEGKAFSGAEWRFHHFGPWSNEAFERIAPALQSVAANEFRYASKYVDDFVRYGLEKPDAEELAQRFEHDLPFVVSNAISTAVREHGSDTADLLRHVYLSPPMLAARPGDLLDLRTVIALRLPDTTTETRKAKLSTSERRRRANIIKTARAEVRKRLAAAGASRVEPDPLPRYDEVFYEGTAQLDGMAGDPVRSSSGELVFDDSVWSSSQRRDNADVP